MPSESTTPEILRTLIQEVADYVRNLALLFGAELGEKARSIRYLMVMAAAGALFATVGFLVLTGALIGAISFGLASWRWALLIVGVGWSFIGLFLMIPVANALRSGLLRFDHTERRVREDSHWIKQSLTAEADARTPR